MSTNKEQLARGLKTLALSLLFMLIGPTALYSAFGNKEHQLFIPVVIIGLAAAVYAIYLGFKGINRIMKALFND